MATGVGEKKIKGPRKLERHFKGVANHRRIEILLIIAKNPDITVDSITETVKANFRTVSQHTQKLALAGLIEKQHMGREVMHKLTPYGRQFVDFIRTFSNQ